MIFAGYSSLAPISVACAGAPAFAQSAAGVQSLGSALMTQAPLIGVPDVAAQNPVGSEPGEDSVVQNRFGCSPVNFALERGQHPGPMEPVRPALLDRDAPCRSGAFADADGKPTPRALLWTSADQSVGPSFADAASVRGPAGRHGSWPAAN